MSNAERLIATYRASDRSKRDTMRMMYVGMRKEFQKIEDSAKNKCAECGQNPHNAYCSKREP